MLEQANPIVARIWHLVHERQSACEIGVSVGKGIHALGGPAGSDRGVHGALGIAGTEPVAGQLPRYGVRRKGVTLAGPHAFRRLECLRYRPVEALPSTGQQFPVNDFPECGMAECNCPVAPYFHHMLIQGRSEQCLRLFDKHPDRCRQQVYRCRAADYRC
jgi:hypothetical protein